MADNDPEMVFVGPLSSMFRPMTVGTFRQFAATAAILFVFAIAAGTPVVFGWATADGMNRVGLSVVLGLAATFPVSVAVMLSRLAKPNVARSASLVMFGGMVASTVLVPAAVYFVGPQLGSVAVYLVELPLVSFFALQRPWAVGATIATMCSYAVALIFLKGAAAPALQWLNVLAAAVGTGVLVGTIASRLDTTRGELAELNQNLEARVTEQVDELERTGRLRRFLSPQIADVVTSEGADEMLAPHRADVAVFFVDLRGFTAFTNAVTAERVMAVLGEYYETVGSVLDEHGATIGGFDGDGVFAYLGDPIAHDDAPAAAIAMAKDVAGRLDALTTKWSSDDVAIGYGIGLAFGEATLGLVGFANRADYTPVGAVVNMAARLCADARHTEIVIDDALRKAAGMGELARRADVDLKGFGVTATFVVGH